MTAKELVDKFDEERERLPYSTAKKLIAFLEVELDRITNDEFNYGRDSVFESLYAYLRDNSLDYISGYRISYIRNKGMML